MNSLRGVYLCICVFSLILTKQDANDLNAPSEYCSLLSMNWSRIRSFVNVVLICPLVSDPAADRFHGPLPTATSLLVSAGFEADAR